MKRYRPYAPEQSYLLPPSPREWLPEGHLAFFIQGLLGELDLGAIARPMQAKDARGERPYAPEMMTALLLYAYATGVYSSRRIARACIEDVAFRVLAAGEQPHFTTLNQFRATHLEALSGLFVQVLKACQSEGLVRLGHVAIDGTKMKANASKHKAMSYDRMQKDDVKLRAEIQEWFEKAQAVDAEEDQVDGDGGTYDPQEEIRRREERLAKMARVREALKKEVAEARAVRLREQAEELRKKAEDTTRTPSKRAEAATLAKKRAQQASLFDDDDRDPPPPSVDSDLPRNVPPHRPDGTPKPKAQRNFTDPDSRLMVRDGAFLQAYNAQLAVDEAHQIIVAAAVSNQGPDNEYFEPMLRRVIQNCDAVPECATADSGYFSAAAVQYAEQIGVEPFISVGKHRNDGAPVEASSAPNQRSTAKLQMRALLESERGRKVYARRKATVEPVFGQIRAARRFGQFSFRGLLKNRCEWLLLCLTHNLLKLWRATQPRLVTG
ncbi:MAG: IS1182 family transposase [Kofleriaceae bacterium]|nr:IS1182 family transposase [Kofleriaceae bacterium]